MNRKHVLTAVLVLVAFASSASAQASRTWVSGVGDDANPCSRTAPCKTFAGAISKTAARGEISVLDPGGFRRRDDHEVDHDHRRGSRGRRSGRPGRTPSSSTPATDRRRLRGLDIEGLGTGLNGIRFLAGGVLHVENCTIERFTGFGISFEPSGASQLTVSDTLVRENGGTAGGGVQLLPGPAGSANATLRPGDLLHAIASASALDDRAKAALRNSTVSGTPSSACTPRVRRQRSRSTLRRVRWPTDSSGGVRSEGAAAIAALSDATMFDNGAGLVSVGGGAVLSFGNNQIAGNTNNGAPTGVLAQQ